MDVKSAVAAAKAYIRDTFAEDQIINVGLEEVEYDLDDGEWLITIGFSRPWDRPRRSAFSAIPLLPGEERPPDPLNREYRIVRVKSDGTVSSVKLRNVAA